MKDIYEDITEAVGSLDTGQGHIQASILEVKELM